MGKKSRIEYFKMIFTRYRQASIEEKSRILDEFCKVCGYARKYAIAKLNGPAASEAPVKRPFRSRRAKYNAGVISILVAVWRATGYLCSIRLKAALPLWLPWIRERFRISSVTEKGLLSISARQMDRRLQERKKKHRRSIYGRTKPGALLKHHIPIKTDHWDVKSPGFTEIDLVSHSGNSAAGEFAYSLNQTDILTTWVETRAVMGKSEAVVVKALDRMRQCLPFPLEGIDSDNGSEFINDHLYRYCQKNKIQFTRGRPYKKDDNAHIEQKNWTHVRKIFGWQRYETQQVVDRMNEVYSNELRWFMNLFTPSMKLKRKVRIGSKIKKIYDQPKAPLDRLIETGKGLPEKIGELLHLRQNLNPFLLAEAIESKLLDIQRVARKIAAGPTMKEPTNKLVEARKKANPHYLFAKTPWKSLGTMGRDSRKPEHVAINKQISKYTQPGWREGDTPPRTPPRKG